ncbi:MAG: cobalamin adenosyltransferase [Clostridium argentinense]|uniref:Cobalamin adenosyltransferase n=1 Tax=Clostridium faecium TaxID=2762223 RepID=A0ABR8YMR1_9CLOT|nr:MULTISPECIES: cobalamin adenosyltransferase [Clostridium]MBD8045539.1 cobalamin adenosyltransferase [Clostridium faecium]MBS5824595.1 cobalamin adenosyltransferase [Clostridium argentinense]MDU1350350.1 cobalamin adenosyltransferase [Clostridium argentinense]
MSVLTESTLRSKLKNENLTEYVIERGTIVTPSARQYLQDKHIKLVYEEERTEKSNQNIQREENIFNPKYVHMNGGVFQNKPEHMTQLNGNKLVSKDHRRIVLRGRLDSLQAKILQTEIQCKNLNEKKVLKDLEEILAYVRKILEVEVTEKELPEISLIGLNSEELRAVSHNPKKYFNIDHIIFPTYEMGDVVVALNALRTESREVEIDALRAFKNEDGELTRNDIALALNRLSSCFYIMMCKYLSGKYK